MLRRITPECGQCCLSSSQRVNVRLQSTAVIQGDRSPASLRCGRWRSDPATTAMHWSPVIGEGIGANGGFFDSPTGRSRPRAVLKHFLIESVRMLYRKSGAMARIEPQAAVRRSSRPLAVRFPARPGAKGSNQHTRDIRKSEIGEKDHVPAGSETRTRNRSKAGVWRRSDVPIASSIGLADKRPRRRTLFVI